MSAGTVIKINQICQLFATFPHLESFQSTHPHIDDVITLNKYKTPSP